MSYSQIDGLLKIAERMNKKLDRGERQDQQAVVVNGKATALQSHSDLTRADVSGGASLMAWSLRLLVNCPHCSDSKSPKDLTRHSIQRGEESENPSESPPPRKITCYIVLEFFVSRSPDRT